MSVEKSCRPNVGTVFLDVAGGEYLEYRIPSASDGVEYQVVDGSGARILSNTDCPPPCVRRWPAQGGSVPPGTIYHTLGLQFFSDQSLTYEVDRKDATDVVVESVRRCRYDNTGEADEYFDPLEIIVG